MCVYIYIYVCMYIYIYVSKTPTTMDHHPLPLRFRPLWQHLSTVGVFAVFDVFAYLGFLCHLSATFELKIGVLVWS